MASRCFYCTVKFTVLVAVAPWLALEAVTTTANVPVGVPGLCCTAVPMLTLHPAMLSNARQASAPASRNLRPRSWLSARAVIPASTSSNIAGGTLPGPCGGNVVDFAVVVIVIVTGPVVVTDAGLKLHAAPAGRPLQAKVTAPSPELLVVTLRVVLTLPPTVTLALLV